MIQNFFVMRTIGWVLDDSADIYTVSGAPQVHNNRSVFHHLCIANDKGLGLRRVLGKSGRPQHYEHSQDYGGSDHDSLSIRLNFVRYSSAECDPTHL